MSAPPHYNYTANAYIAIYLASKLPSPYLSDPRSLCTVHPALVHVGSLGVIRDIQILSVPKTEEGWLDEKLRRDVISALKGKIGNGIESVEVMEEPKARTKRGEL